MLALWCVYQSACKVASYLLGAIVSVLKGLGTRVGAHGDRPGQMKVILPECNTLPAARGALFWWAPLRGRSRRDSASAAPSLTLAVLELAPSPLRRACRLLKSHRHLIQSN